MKRNVPAFFRHSHLTSAAIALVVAVTAAVWAPSRASAQELKLQFAFEDDGTTTTDAVSGTVLRLVNGGGTAADLHTAAGAGVAGMGRALDFGAAVKQGGTGPVAYSTNNTASIFGSIGSFTATLWIKPGSSLLTNGFPRFFTLGNNGIVDHGSNYLQLLGNGNFQPTTTSVQAFVNTNVTSTTSYGGFDMPVGQWSFLALVYNGTTLSFYGGSESAPVALMSSTNFEAGAVNLSGAWSFLLGNRLDRIRGFQGEMDEVRFYVGEADAAFLEAVRQASLLPAAPQGLSALGCNSQASLSWTPVQGATGYLISRSGTSGTETNYAASPEASYLDSNVTVGETYYYTVAATNEFGTGTNATEVSVSISTGPSFTITEPPTDQSVCAGQTATFSVAATGTGLSYSWQSATNGLNWSDLASYGSSYTTGPTVSTENGTQYRVVVTGACGSLASAPAVLTVNSSPVITRQPANQTVSPG
ncbi:MAG: LamG-like jellyroll fold domain-containing protein, partial [Verrucomicrobiota bacterium]